MCGMEREDKEIRQVRRRLNEAIASQDITRVTQILLDDRAGQLNLNEEWVWFTDREKDRKYIDDSPEDLLPQHETFLQHAVRLGDLDIVCQLLNAGADVDGCNRSGSTALSTACAEGQLNMVNYLIRRSANVNKPDNSGRTPLMIACIRHALPLIKALLDAKANADYTDCKRNSALHLTLDSQTDDSRSTNAVVDLLARYGCDVNQINKNRMSAVMMAAKTGNTDVIQTLLLAECELEHVDGDHCTALCLAAKVGHANAVRLLLQNGADPAISDHKKVTPLLHAVKKQYESVINVILYSGRGLSTIDMTDYEGTTPILHSVKTACQFRNAALHSVGGEITKLLLSKGCDVNIPHRSLGWTPLFAAALTGNSDIAGLLIQHNADVNKRDTTGETALHATLNSGYSNMVKLLLHSGCDVNIRNRSGVTALYKAVANRCSTQIVEMLVDAGSVLDAVEFLPNTTALHAALSSPDSHTEGALLLIAKGCNVNHTDAMGTTPLTKAIQHGDSAVTSLLLSLPHCDVNIGTHKLPLHAAVTTTEEHIIQQLVSRGADINKTNRQGMRPIQIAIEANQHRIIRLLLTLGCSLDPTESETLPAPKGCCFKYHDAHPHTELQPLFAAVKFDDFKMFKTLLSHYHRKPYRLLQTLHDMLTIAFDTGVRATQMLSSEGRKLLLELLRAELTTPSSLLDLCRGQVRSSLSVGVSWKVQTLSLPTSLKHYLLHDTERHLDLSDLNEVSDD